MPAFFRTLEKIKPVYDWAYKIMLFICKLLLIADIIITSITVAGRYFPFFTAPHWGEEIVLTLMVYMAVLCRKRQSSGWICWPMWLCWCWASCWWYRAIP